ncbi:LacI family transcriptional regulator [Agromyces badenianii]|uniref:LacI family transcriptional regulator n=1 Tax=Agromyces badenianii TaxID=2080742 RepID=A0A2S0WZ50_9MICO|nr:LacI family DNA-binding transcriptional regulator [Agromyces badenianii]AWB96633.1 LacI family transcriptional regulator [Agromyces badenianii]
MSELPKNRKVTRADVARYSGVSTAVVSYVLNNGPKPVAPLTRERVLEAVRVLGYRPNAAARALSTGSADMIGMIVVDSRNPFFAQLCHALDRATVRRDRSLLIANSDREHVAAADQIHDLAARQIGGLIIADVLTAVEQAIIESLDIPVVLINQYTGASKTPAIGVDFRAGAKSAVEHLIEHGYRDIAFVGSALAIDRRERGWSDALSEAGLPLGPRLHAPFSYAGGYEAGLALAESERRPRAVFAASDQIAVGLLAALHRAGLRVPDDIAVVSFDGTMESAYTWPPLTTVAQPIAAMADEAIRQLVTGVLTPGLTTFPTELVVRESCGCAAGVSGVGAGLVEVDSTSHLDLSL